LAQVNRELGSERSRVQTLALITDVLASATLVSGGVALYFTLQPSEVPEQAARRGSALAVEASVDF
jgi:hypothetical protein